MQPAQVSSTKLTYDDYLLFPDDGRRHELIDGEHYVTPAPSLRHQEIAKRATGWPRRCCQVFPSRLKISFAEARPDYP